MIPEKLTQLLETLATKVREDLRDNYVIFGSAVAVLRGIDLRRHVENLDVFVSEHYFRSILNCFDLRSRLADGVRIEYLNPAPDVEIHKSFSGVTFNKVRENATIPDGCHGFPVASLEHLRVTKFSRWSCIDRRDIACISDYMAHTQNAGGDVKV